MIINELKPPDLRAFIKLRAEIEAETKYMPMARGERKESLLRNLIKLYIYRKRHYTFLAKEEDGLAGYIILVLGRFSKFRGNAYIANVSVATRHRGKGIGRKLMDKVENFSKERGARRLELEVFANNTIAIDLYKKLGYVTEGIKRKAVESKDGYDDIILMAKFLR